MKSTSYKNDYLKELKKPKYARGLLKAAFSESIEDGNWEAFGLLLQDIVETQGNQKDFAKRAKVNRKLMIR